MSGESTGRALGRRTFLARVAVAGGAAWAAPTIITMRQADAASLTSAPPEDPDDPPVVNDKTLAKEPSTVPAPQVLGITELPRTGASLDEIAAAGLVSVAGGAALVLWSADAQQKAPRHMSP